MLPLLEIAYALRGLWRLVHLDPRGLEYFDRSVAGFWRSFRVALLVAPAEALLYAGAIQDLKTHASWERLILVEILSYIVGWLVFPVAAYELARRMNRTTEYVGYIVVYNWSAIIAYSLFLLASAPHAAGMVSSGVGDALSHLGYLVFLGYLWFLAKSALALDGVAAAGFVLLDFGLTMVLSLVTANMIA